MNQQADHNTLRHLAAHQKTDTAHAACQQTMPNSKLSDLLAGLQSAAFLLPYLVQAA